MVFEGGLAETRRREQWFRLRTNDFGAAAGKLIEERLITETRDGELIALSPGIQTDRVVNRLVTAGFAVFEIAHEEETLEDFYLSLMNDERTRGRTHGERPMDVASPAAGSSPAPGGSRRTYDAPGGNKT